MNKYIVSVACCVLVFIPGMVSAGPIIRTGETVSVDNAQSLKGDFYGFGSSVIVSGQAEDDVYVAGGSVTINAPIQQDLTVLGGVVQVHGDIGDDVRIIGGDVTIAKPVKGDVVMFGDTLTILSTARIEGDILFMGGKLTIDGDVVGGVHGTVDEVRINSEVGGDISLGVARHFSIGDNAHLLSDTVYESAYDVVRAQDAVVDGDMRRVEVGASTHTAITLSQILLIEVGILLFASLGLYFVARRYTVSIGKRAHTRFGMYGLVGIGMLVTTPFLAILLCATVLGLFAGVVMLFGYILTLLLAFLLTPVCLGYVLQKLILRHEGITAYTVVGGVVALCLLPLIPYIGGLILFSFVMITLGTLGMAIYHKVRS